MNTNTTERGWFLVEALLAVAITAVAMYVVMPVIVEKLDERTPAPPPATCTICGAYAPCYNHTR